MFLRNQTGFMDSIDFQKKVNRLTADLSVNSGFELSNSVRARGWYFSGLFDTHPKKKTGIVSAVQVTANHLCIRLHQEGITFPAERGALQLDRGLINSVELKTPGHAGRLRRPLVVNS